MRRRQGGRPVAWLGQVPHSARLPVRRHHVRLPLLQPVGGVRPDAVLVPADGARRRQRHRHDGGRGPHCCVPRLPGADSCDNPRRVRGRRGDRGARHGVRHSSAHMEGRVRLRRRDDVREDERPLEHDGAQDDIQRAGRLGGARRDLGRHGDAERPRRGRRDAGGARRRMRRDGRLARCHRLRAGRIGRERRHAPGRAEGARRGRRVEDGARELLERRGASAQARMPAACSRRRPPLGLHGVRRLGARDVPPRAAKRVRRARRRDWLFAHEPAAGD